MQQFKSLADLLDLQDVDSQIDRLLAERSSLPALAAYKKAHKTHEKATATHVDLAEQLKETALTLDKHEGELELFESKIDTHEQRLFAGGLTARDAENLRLDVQSLKKRRSTMEDDVLMLLDSHEELETAVAAAVEAVASAQVTMRTHEAEVGEAWKRIDAEIARKESRKEAIVPLIDPEILELYESLRAHKEGVGAARLADGVCGGCHLTLSPAEQLEVLNDDLPRCLHCRRILVV